MQQIRNSDDIKRLGTILGVWAHPDDEVLSMCGILCAAVDNGQDVVCVTATRGEAGVQDESRWPARKLGRIREQELKDAYHLIGIGKHHFLDYPDGACSEVDDQEAVQRLVSLLETYQPDSIFTFGPDGMTGHPDHQAVSRWTDQAVAVSGSKAVVYHSILTPKQYQAIRKADKKHDIFFNVKEPRLCETDMCNVYLNLDDNRFECKLHCMRAMPSQYEGLMAEFGDNLRPSLGVEAFIRAE